MLTQLASMLIAAPVGICVAATDDWTVASLVADALERALDASLRRGAVRLPNDERCKDRPEECVEQARAEFRVDDLLLLRVFVGVTKHLVIVESFSRDREPKKISLSLPDGGAWSGPLAEVAALLPEEPEPPHAPPDLESPVVEPAAIWGPVLIVAGALVIATATILGERADSTRTKLIDGTASPAEFDRLHTQRSRYAISSLALFGIGGLLGGGGVILVLLDW